MKTATPILRMPHAGLTALETLEAELKADGFLEGQPLHIDRATIACDEEVLAEAMCDECTHVGLGLVPFRKPGTLGYRCVALCPCCLDAVEF